MEINCQWKDDILNDIVYTCSFNYLNEYKFCDLMRKFQSLLTKKYNHINNIYIENCAVSDENKKINFYYIKEKTKFSHSCYGSS